MTDESRARSVDALFLLAQIAAFFWSVMSIRKTESHHKAELKRLRETKTLAELMSINMGA